MDHSNDLAQRLFQFAVNVLKYLKTIRSSIENNVVKYQLAKSATSSGANYEESQAASSKADFANKVKIALKEMRESNYWLRICQELKLGNAEIYEELTQESKELMNILGSIAKKVSKV